MLLPLRGVATPGHGEGEGSAVDKFRVSGTQETVEGAGANEVSGVLSEASCCRCGAPLIKKKRPTLFSRPPLSDLQSSGQDGKSFAENGKMRIFAAPKKKSDDFWCNGVLPERV